MSVFALVPVCAWSAVPDVTPPRRPRHPGIRLTLAQLTVRPTHKVTVSFCSVKGTKSHTETGVPVATLLGQLGLATDSTREDDELSFTVLAISADGYHAVVSYGEISPSSAIAADNFRGNTPVRGAPPRDAAAKKSGTTTATSGKHRYRPTVTCCLRIRPSG